MEKFWKAALSVAGIGAVGLFVFYGLYKKWLDLPIFAKLTSEQTFFLMCGFLGLTFLSVVLAIGAWLSRSPNSESSDAALHRLEQSWQGVNYIDCDRLIGPSVERASNALDMTSVYWRKGFLDKKLIVERYGVSFVELFEQIDGCAKRVPGYNKPIKYCKDFLNPLIRATYAEIKKYGPSK